MPGERVADVEARRAAQCLESLSDELRRSTFVAADFSDGRRIGGGGDGLPQRVEAIEVHPDAPFIHQPPGDRRKVGQGADIDFLPEPAQLVMTAKLFVFRLELEAGVALGCQARDLALQREIGLRDNLQARFQLLDLRGWVLRHRVDRIRLVSAASTTAPLEPTPGGAHDAGGEQQGYACRDSAEPDTRAHTAHRLTGEALDTVRGKIRGTAAVVERGQCCGERRAAATGCPAVSDARS